MWIKWIKQCEAFDVFFKFLYLVITFSHFPFPRTEVQKSLLLLQLLSVKKIHKYIFLLFQNWERSHTTSRAKGGGSVKVWSYSTAITDYSRKGYRKMRDVRGERNVSMWTSLLWKLTFQCLWIIVSMWSLVIGIENFWTLNLW